MSTPCLNGHPPPIALASGRVTFVVEIDGNPLELRLDLADAFRALMAISDAEKASDSPFGYLDKWKDWIAKETGHRLSSGYAEDLWLRIPRLFSDFRSRHVAISQKPPTLPSSTASTPPG